MPPSIADGGDDDAVCTPGEALQRKLLICGTGRNEIRDPGGLLEGLICAPAGVRCA